MSTGRPSLPPSILAASPSPPTPSSANASGSRSPRHTAPTSPPPGSHPPSTHSSARRSRSPTPIPTSSPGDSRLPITPGSQGTPSSAPSFYPAPPSSISPSSPRTASDSS